MDLWRNDLDSLKRIIGHTRDFTYFTVFILACVKAIFTWCQAYGIYLNKYSISNKTLPQQKTVFETIRQQILNLTQLSDTF